jgi:hypothetical protein
MYTGPGESYRSNIPPWDVFIDILRRHGHHSIADTIARYL